MTAGAIWLRMHAAPMVIGAWISAGQNPPLLPDIGRCRSARCGYGRHGRDQIAQELRRDHFAAFLMQFDEGELTRPVDCNEQPQFALGRLDLGDVDVKIADRVGLELALWGLVAGDLGQTADPVTL